MTLTASLSTARLDDLVLARTAGAPPTSALDLARALRGLAPPTWDDARWNAAVDASLARARASGDGPAAAGRRLGAKGAIPWKRVVERILPGLALGIAPSDTTRLARLKDRDGWAAAIVGRALGVWQGGPPPTLAAVCDALVWRAVGLPGPAKRTPPEMRAHFVAPLIAAPATGSGPADRSIRLIAATQVGATRADLRALREALVRRWLCGQEWRDGEPLGDFASAVRAAAARATDGVFGERKVFIRDVWRDPAFAGIELDDFKRRLVVAHKAGLVSLVRADLAGAMNPDAIRESETAHLEARYHFIERGTS